MIWWMMMADQKKMLRFWGMPKMPTLFASVTQIRVDGNQKGGMLPPSALSLAYNCLHVSSALGIWNA